jgi:hypothetical protein
VDKRLHFRVLLGLFEESTVLAKLLLHLEKRLVCGNRLSQF